MNLIIELENPTGYVSLFQTKINNQAFSLFNMQNAFKTGYLTAEESKAINKVLFKLSRVNLAYGILPNGVHYICPDTDVVRTIVDLAKLKPEVMEDYPGWIDLEKNILFFKDKSMYLRTKALIV